MKAPAPSRVLWYARVLGLVAAGAGILVPHSAGSESPGGEPERLSAASVLERIKEQGPRKALDGLFYDDAVWLQVHSGVASGEAEWLEVGLQLFAGSDAGSMYDLNLAFGEALVRNPEAVLELAPEISASCGNMDQPYLRGLDTALEELDRRERGVRSVSRKDLQGKRSLCLRKLEQLRARLPSFFAK